MKIIGYLIFSIVFYICRIFPIKKEKVFCIMTHDCSDDSNVGVVISYLKSVSNNYVFNYIKSHANIKNNLSVLFDFFIVKPYHLATSKYILQDNIFLPITFVRFSKKVKVIQFWHGTGTIKKFGQDVNQGMLYKLESSVNKTITHLIVNSHVTKNIYKSAFGIDESKIFVYGSPITDILFNADREKKDIEGFYSRNPLLKDKKLLLYAPTFRDNEINTPKVVLELDKIVNELEDNYVLGLKLHPFVAKSFHLSNDYNGKIVDFSNTENTTVLLKVTDLLITDYSSIIFDYCILEKPMVFFAYDYGDFSDHGRGFYKDYFSYVPGQVALTTDELISIIKDNRYDYDLINNFKNYHYEYLDGLSAKRIYENVINK